MDHLCAGHGWQAVHHRRLWTTVPIRWGTLPNKCQEQRSQHIFNDGQNCVHLVAVCCYSLGKCRTHSVLQRWAGGNPASRVAGAKSQNTGATARRVAGAKSQNTGATARGVSGHSRRRKARAELPTFSRVVSCAE